MFGEKTEDTREFTVLEAGSYTAILEDCSLDETGNHPMIMATLRVVSGDATNRKLWKRFYVSEGTCAKFLPWQFGVMGFKKELDEMNCTSYQDTARNAMTLMGKVIGKTFKVGVSITEGQNGKQYNDLVFNEMLEAGQTSQNMGTTANVKNHAPGANDFNKDEALPF